MASFLERLRERVSSGVTSFTSNLRAGEPVTVAATVAGVAVAGYFVASCALAPGDGPQYETGEQRVFPESFPAKVPSGKTVAVKKITKGTIPAVADTLALNSKTNPMLKSFASESVDDEGRVNAFRWLYGVLLRASVPTSSGAINLQTEDAKAAAVWYPGDRELSFGGLLWNGALMYIARFSGWERRGRFEGYSTYTRQVRGRVMGKYNGAFFYLLTYGSRPELPETESNDALAAVVVPVLQRADALGRPCYVEVTEDRYLRFFESLGFKNVEDDDVPNTLYGNAVHCLVREASKL